MTNFTVKIGGMLKSAFDQPKAKVGVNKPHS